MAANIQAEKDIQVLLPIHNEGDSIGDTLQEWYDELSPRLSIEFIACEDGSTDNTKEVLHDCSKRLPIKLLIGVERKGYSKAVVDGFIASDAPWVLAIDSDGQCDPKDFWNFWDRRFEYDVVIGWRVHRADAVLRKVMSGCFKLWHRILFRTPLHDPSCPYVLVQKRVLENIAHSLGVLQQGLWWEFVARVYTSGFRITEIPVHHRHRKTGATQIYRWRKLPGIGMHHCLGLFTIWREVRTGIGNKA